MSSPVLTRAFAVLLLSTALLAPAAFAAPPRLHPAPQTATSTLGSPRDALANLWTSLARLWAEAGCSIDPNGGHCTSAPVHPTGDNGCSIDPSGGHCLGSQSVAPASDEGCSIDPSGRCIVR